MQALQTSNLIPEQRMIEALSPLWQRRFERACAYMQEHFAESPRWEDVCAHCAVSPYHFHRIFSSVFGETPGQYLIRLKLNHAVRLLFNNQQIQVLDVAVDCGFSSSQALAKSLKKELGLTAKKIRQLAATEDIAAIKSLLNDLGSPTAAQAASLEQELAAGIRFVIQQFPERYLRASLIKPVVMRNIVQQCLKLQKHSNGGILIVTPVEDLLKAYREQAVQVGYIINTETQATLTLAAGDYLCCSVRLSNKTAYIAAWEGLYNHLVTLDRSPDNKEGRFKV